MKRIFCILLTLLLLLCAVPAQAEGEFTFILSAASGEVGDTVTLTGSVANAPACASYRVIMTYDPAVLEVVEGSNAGSAGIFIINPKATYNDRPAINALSADAAKVLEGTQDLFTVTFKIIGENDTKNQPIEIAHQEFFAADLSRQVPVIQNGGIQIGTDDPAEETPDAPTEEEPTPPESEQPETDAPIEEPETEKEEETLPEGNWAIDEKNEEVIFVPESGAPITYVPEFPESIEVGKPTEIILKDESGNDAGSITVEKEEDGTINVIEQNAKLPQGKKFPLFLKIFLPLLGVLVAAGIAATVLILVKEKKKKNINKNGENDHE